MACLSDFVDRYPRLWSYLVLACSILSSAMNIGLMTGMAGYLTVAQSEEFAVSVADSSWTTALMFGTKFLASPLIAVLMKLISTQLVQCGGGILMVIGAILASFATKNWIVVVCMGLISGVGSAATALASAGILSYYFPEDKIYMALAFKSLGSTAGIFIFPIVAHLIFTRYNFQIALTVVACIFSTEILNGLTFVVPPKEPKSTANTKSILQSLKSVLTNPRVIAYSTAGLLRRSGLTAFYALFTNYMLTDINLTKQEAATENAGLGALTIIGALLTIALQRFDYDRLTFQTVLIITYGVMMTIVTEMTTFASVMICMGLIGLGTGMQAANTLGLARSIGGKDEMVLVWSLEIALQGIGALFGPQISSLLLKHFESRIAIKFGGIACTLGGLCVVPLLIHECMKKKTNDEKPCTNIKHESLNKSFSEYYPQLEDEPLLNGSDKN